MGFMAGFGSAFSKSYEGAADRRAAEEQDVFRMKYGDFLDRRKDREKFEREQSKNVSSAKSYAEAYGANPEAWPKIKEWIDAGMTDTEIAKNIQNGDFVVGPTPAPQPDTPNDAASTGDQTKAAMGGAEGAQVNNGEVAPQGAGGAAGQSVAPTVAGAAAPAATADTPGFGWHKSDPMKKANDKIAQLEGISASEVDKTYNPDSSITSTPAGIIAYKPRPTGSDLTKVSNVAEAVTALELAKQSGDPARIKIAENLLKAQQAAKMQDIRGAAMERAAAEGTQYTPTRATRWKDGKFVGMVNISPDPNDPTSYVTDEGEPVDNHEIRVMDNTQEKAVTALLDNIAKPMEEYTKAQSRYVEQATLAQDAMKIVQQDPAVTSRVGDFAQVATNLAGDIKGVLGLAQDEQIALDQDADGVISTSEFAAMDDLEQRASQILNSGTMDRLNQLAIKRSLLESKMLKMAYTQAAELGQTGQGVAVKELERIYNSMMPRNPSAFVQVMKGSLASQKHALDQQYDLLAHHNLEINNFKRRFNGIDPLPDFQSIDEIMSGSDSHPDSMKTGDGASQAKQLPSTAPEGFTYKATLPDGREVYVNEKGKQIVRKKQ